MEYITSVQAAEKWGISPTRVTILANGGRIPGAVRLGKRWMIPEHAEKPLDNRRRKTIAEETKEESPFRFPSFAGREEASFIPPLSPEEQQIKKVEEAFFACRFKDAKELLSDLTENAQSRYIQIYALYCATMIAIALNDVAWFFSCYGRLSEMLQEDFPYSIEMRNLLCELQCALGAVPDFEVVPGYTYHESYFPHLVFLSSVSLFYSDRRLSPVEMSGYGLACTLLDKRDCYVELTAANLYLGLTYGMAGRREEQLHHLRCALELAEEHDLLYIVATEYYYMESMFKPVVSECSEELQVLLCRLGEDIHSRYVRFMQNASMTSIFKLLQHKEFFYVFCAVRGYSNKEVAARLHITENVVKKRYTAIYELLGVSSKQELVDLYDRSLDPHIGEIVRNF